MRRDRSSAWAELACGVVLAAAQLLCPDPTLGASLEDLVEAMVALGLVLSGICGLLGGRR